MLVRDELRYFDRTYLPLRDDAGAVIGALGIVGDVSARRHAEGALRASQDLLRVAVEASGIGLWSWDVERDVVVWGDSMCVLAGVAPGMAPRGRQGDLAPVHPDDQESAGSVIAHRLAAGRCEGEPRLMRPDGSVPWLLTKGTVSRRDGDHPRHGPRTRRRHRVRGGAGTGHRVLGPAAVRGPPAGRGSRRGGGRPGGAGGRDGARGRRRGAGPGGGRAHPADRGAHREARRVGPGGHPSFSRTRRSRPAWRSCSSMRRCPASRGRSCGAACARSRRTRGQSTLRGTPARHPT